MLFWNATVANLTLMALGSSAPEILLSVIETVTTLGACPGELGPSTIVGSAAYNLLMISAISVWSVTAENDTDRDKDPSMRGIKKINDVGVFTITTVFSIISYVWLWVVLQDSFVTVTEAVITIVLFFLLILLSWMADKWKRLRDEQETLLKGTALSDDKEVFIEYSALEIQRELMAE